MRFPFLTRLARSFAKKKLYRKIGVLLPEVRKESTMKMRSELETTTMLLGFYHIAPNNPIEMMIDIRMTLTESINVILIQF